MELLEKTSTPAFNLKYPLKYCGYCKSWEPINEFYKDGSREDGLAGRCRVCCHEYNVSPQGKANTAKYGKSEKGKVARGKANRKYRQSYKGHLMLMRMVQKYYNSPWGYAVRREYGEADRLSGRAAERQKERYHRIQDEAGCHHWVRDFYPGYRLKKAFMEGNYTVVEVKY